MPGRRTNVCAARTHTQFTHSLSLPPPSYTNSHAHARTQGVEPNLVTQQLMAAVGRRGVASVEEQQVAAAALSAIFAAAGSLLFRTGIF